MTSVAVVAHVGKTFGGGLRQLRKALGAAGQRNPVWYKVSKSREAGRAARKAVKAGAELVFVWGGDGTVQRCIDALAGTDVAVAILPAGTANLLARNFGIPQDIIAAVDIGLRGQRLALDVGVIKGERFAVMAGTGFDAIMLGDVGKNEKERRGRLAYIRSSVKAMKAKSFRTTIRVDGAPWFKGKATCILIGNVGRVMAGLPLFPDASPSDGLLEVGVATADSIWQWLRILSRVARGRPEKSPLIETTRGSKIVIERARKATYELDGGVRPPAKKLKVRVQAGAINLCVPVKYRLA